MNSRQNAQQQQQQQQQQQKQQQQRVQQQSGRKQYCASGSRQQLQAAGARPAVSRTRHVCDLQALQSVVWWLMAGLVNPLIRAAFYVTETEPYKQQVFYFRCEAGYLWRRAEK